MLFQKLLEVDPEHREERALRAVGDDFRLEASAEQADDAVLGDHDARRVRVRDRRRVRLLGRLHNAQAVRRRVRRKRRAEADAGVAHALEPKVVVDARHVLLQKVVGEEPREVANTAINDKGREKLVRD